MSKWYIETKKEFYVVEADNASDAFLNLAKELPIENAGILMVCSSEPFDIGEKADDLIMLSPMAYQMAGVISQEECDILVEDVMERVSRGLDDD